MEKVNTVSFFLNSVFFMLHFLGEYFGFDGKRYEGEWKDAKVHGQGKKMKNELLYDLFILNLCCCKNR